MAAAKKQFVIIILSTTLILNSCGVFSEDPGVEVAYWTLLGLSAALSFTFIATGTSYSSAAGYYSPYSGSSSSGDTYQADSSSNTSSSGLGAKLQSLHCYFPNRRFFSI